MSVDDCMPITNIQLTSSAAMVLQAAIHYAVNSKDKVVIAAAGNLTANGDSTDQNGQQATACQNVPQNANPDPNQVKPDRGTAGLRGRRRVGGVGRPDHRGAVAVHVWGPWVTIAAPGQRITSVDPAANRHRPVRPDLDKASRSRCRAPVSRRRTWPVSWPWSGPGSRP